MLLTITNLYPRQDEPNRGLFNMQFFSRLSLLLTRRFTGGGDAAGIFNVCLVPCWRVWRWPAIRRWKAPPGADVATRYLPVFYIPILGRDLNWFTYSTALRRLRHEAAAHGAILATWLYPDAVAAADLARHVGKPLWIKLHGGDINHLNSRLRRRKALEACHQAAGIFCVSHLLARRLGEAGIDPAKIHAVPNGVDSTMFTPTGTREPRPDGRKIVLFAGHLAKIKGPDLLLSAWRRLLDMQAQRQGESRQEEGLKLLIIGNGRMKRQLERNAHRLGIHASIALLGTRRHDEMPRWMRSVDCLCLPSRSEGMPNVVLEALACGTPVVAGDVGEVPLLIKNGINGYVVPLREPDFPGRLATAVHTALHRSWDRRDIAATVTAYTWEQAAETAIDLSCAFGAQEQPGINAAALCGKPRRNTRSRQRENDRQ